MLTLRTTRPVANIILLAHAAVIGTLTTATVAQCNGRWVQANVTGILPPPREGHGTVFVPVENEIFVLGGSNLAGTFYNDVWSFNGSQWTLESANGPAASNRPAGWRLGSVTVVDNFQGTRHIVVAGGLTSAGVSQQVWSWSRAEGWIRRADMPVPIWNGASFSAGGNTSYLLGGSSTPDCTGISNHLFVIVTNAATGPSVALRNTHPLYARWGFAFAASPDTISPFTIAFGGDTSCAFAPGVPLNIIPQLAPNVAPSGIAGFIPRNNVAASTAVNAFNGITFTLLFGGNTQAFPNGYSDVTQVFNSLSYVTLNQTPRPIARLAQGAIAYDDQNRRHVLFGGLGVGNQPLNDTWFFTYNPIVTAPLAAMHSAVSHQSVLLQAAVLGPENTVRTWTHEGVPLTSGPRPWGSTVQVLGDTLLITDVKCLDAGGYTLTALPVGCNANVPRAASTSTILSVSGNCCDTIDFNRNGVFPEDQDVIDFFNVLAGASCPTCGDIDINNNAVFPEDQDVIDFFFVLAGGTCP
jgi:hypothetical protein